MYCIKLMCQKYLFYFSIIISGKAWPALYLIEKSQKEDYLMVHWMWTFPVPCTALSSWLPTWTPRILFR